ncbi:hypothetical protein GT347_02980 [Xylophilus rhododendri]|uniref:Uncharacterized protein n=1 Tax=Xylophilus rhododendri TaxID=2697032 RepID=A0A857J1K7_9BURK|nr:hypothetical protein [Xylophilus rhododendri]QHI97039.1 hypothetical protein GT347_02980 [Xylophilus rhododendri]
MPTYLQVLNGSDFSLSPNNRLEYKIEGIHYRVEVFPWIPRGSFGWMRWTKFGADGATPLASQEFFVNEMEYRSWSDVEAARESNATPGRIRISDQVHQQITMKGVLASISALFPETLLRKRSESIFKADMDYRVAPFPDTAPDSVVLIKFVHS